MMMLAVKDFNRQLYTCGQLLSAEHKHAACDLPNTDVVVLEELNMSILSRNCRTPGFSTLIANLVQTYSNSEKSELWKPYDWRQEYHYGCSHELYPVELPSEYVGMTFCEVALLIYEEHQQTLIAAECELRDGSSVLLANPAGEVARLRAGTRCFVMALSRKKARKISTKGEEMPESAFGTAPSYKQRARDTNDVPMLPVLASRRSFEGSRRSLEEVRPVSRRKSTGTSQVAGEEVMLADEEERGDFVEHEDDLSWLMMQKTKRTVREVVSETGGLGPWTSVYPGFKVGDMEANCEDCHPCTRLNGHLIVAGTGEGLVDLIAPLRSVDAVQDIPVVIINPEPIPEAIWNIVGRFPDVFFVKGKASDYRSLALAQLSTASSIVLLTNPTSRSLDGQMIDAETVFTFRRLMPRLRSAFLVAELGMSSPPVQNARLSILTLGSARQQRSLHISGPRPRLCSSPADLSVDGCVVSHHQWRAPAPRVPLQPLLCGRPGVHLVGAGLVALQASQQPSAPRRARAHGGGRHHPQAAAGLEPRLPVPGGRGVCRKVIRRSVRALHSSAQGHSSWPLPLADRRLPECSAVCVHQPHAKRRRLWERQSVPSLSCG